MAVLSPPPERAPLPTHAETLAIATYEAAWRLQRVADEPAARAVGWELADAVGLHARLFEQPPVDGELPVVRVV